MSYPCDKLHRTSFNILIRRIATEWRIRMKIMEEEIRDSIKISISGNVENNTCKEFQNCLLETFQRTKKVILDFGEVNYINSMGLRALLLTLQKAENVQGELIVKNVNDNIMDLFRITGFDEMLRIV